jgi:hypothetical protein
VGATGKKEYGEQLSAADRTMLQLNELTSLALESSVEIAPQTDILLPGLQTSSPLNWPLRPTVERSRGLFIAVGPCDVS